MCVGIGHFWKGVLLRTWHCVFLCTGNMDQVCICVTTGAGNSGEERERERVPENTAHSTFLIVLVLYKLTTLCVPDLTPIKIKSKTPKGQSPGKHMWWVKLFRHHNYPLLSELISLRESSVNSFVFFFCISMWPCLMLMALTCWVAKLYWDSSKLPGPSGWQSSLTNEWEEKVECRQQSVLQAFGIYSILPPHAVFRKYFV